MTDPAYARAFEADCLARERLEHRIGRLLGIVIYPIWLVFDFALARPYFVPFLAIRIAAVAIVASTFLVTRGPISLGRTRAVLCFSFFVFEAGIACMVPFVGEAYAFYMGGFSIAIWTCGILLSWPIVYTVGMSAGAVAVWVGVDALVVRRHGASEIVAGLLYLGTVVAISAVSTHTRRRLYEQLFAARYQVDQKNAELSDAIENRKRAEAKLVESEKLSALGRLLAGLSHEINNPANVVRNNLDPVKKYFAGARAVLERGRAGPVAADELARLWVEHDIDFAFADFDPAVEAMRSAVDRVASIHESLRAFVRGDAPARVLGDVNLGLRATVALLRRNLPSGVTLTERYGDIPEFEFHPGELNQVFFNLLQNAVDALGDKGRIVVESRVAEGHVEVSVADDGPGVSTEAAARLFEPFFTTKGVGQGTGLGLATSYQILARHRGSLALDPGHAPGARFVARLPLRGAPAPEEPSAS
jgi:signal transduction histidine kinase